MLNNREKYIYLLLYIIPNRINMANPLLSLHHKFQSEMPNDMERVLDPDMSDERRCELLNMVDMDVAEKYSWAIPDERALQIISEFGPIVEIGAGLGYWSKLLSDRGVDVIAYDICAPKPSAFSTTKSNQKQKSKYWFDVRQGGPEVLKGETNRALLLCYPDDFEESEESLALKCLECYQGDTVIHVGELFSQSYNLPNPWYSIILFIFIDQNLVRISRE